MSQPTYSNYSAQEIQAAVEQLVQSSITYPLDTLGVRRSDTTFGDIQQAAANIFILYPNSPFYVVQLGLQRVLDQVTSESATLTSLLQAVSVLGRSLLPVTDVSPLFSVQASLQSLATAAANRTSTYADITKAPAYQQFSTSAASFLSGPAGTAIKMNGNIVQTPQQAVAAIPGLLSQLAQSHSTLVATVTSLVNGIENYNSLNLPNIVSSSILSNAASLVGADAAALNSLTPTQRLASIRSVILNLLATQAVVNTFGSFNGASDFYTLSGVGMPFSDALHAAFPAVLESGLFNSFVILAGVSDDLNLQVDGGGPVDVYMTPSTVAVIKGAVSDATFLIGNGTLPTADPSPPYTATPDNHYFYVSIDGVDYEVMLTLSTSITSPRTADQVAADINAVLPSSVQASSYYSPLRFQGQMVIPAGLDQTWTLLVPGSANFGPAPSGLGVLVGDSVDVLTGPNAGTGPYGGRWLISAVTEVSGSWTLTVTGTTVADPSATVQIGPASRNLLIACVDPASQVPAETTLEVYSVDAVSAAALTTLGLPDSVSFQCLQTQPDALAADINAKTGVVTAATAFSAVAGPISTAHADTSNSNRIVFSEAETLGTSAFTGTTLTYTVSAITVVGTISTGDTIALRSGPNPNVGWVITTVNGQTVQNYQPVVGDVIVATGSVAGTGASAVDAELGPTLSVAKYQVVTVTGGPSAGTYVVSGPGATAIDVLLLNPLPVTNSFTSPTTNPLVMTASIGNKYLTLASKNTTTSSEVIVSGLGMLALFSPVPPFEAIADTTSSSFSGTRLTVTIGTIVQPGHISVGDCLAANATNDTVVSYIIQSINGSTTATDHALTTGDTIVALGTLNTPLTTQVVFLKPIVQLGTTPWFQLPSIPNGLQPGDLLELYATQYNNPTNIYPITSVDTQVNVIGVGVDENTGNYIEDGMSWSFSTQPVPFAMLRVGTVNDFSYIQGLLQTWLDLPENQPLYLTNLNGLINPLLITTPTAAQVQTAINAINQLYGFLATVEAQALSIQPTECLESIIPLYTVEAVPPIDALISTYTAKGADAAIDTLLEGEFSTFFGLTDESSSYAGQFQGAVRAVAMNDLPVRKVNRPSAQSGQLISQSVSPDFEYTANAVTESMQGEQVNPPTDYGQPSSYGSTAGSEGAGANGAQTVPPGNNPNGTAGGPA